MPSTLQWLYRQRHLRQLLWVGDAKRTGEMQRMDLVCLYLARGALVQKTRGAVVFVIGATMDILWHLMGPLLYDMFFPLYFLERERMISGCKR